MSDDLKPQPQSLIDFFVGLGVQLRVALSSGMDQDYSSREIDSPIDPDFEGWLHNDPMVTGNPASRYADDAPGHLTGNGLGSLEIGAADD